MRIKLFSLLTIVALLSACASAPTLQAPHPKLTTPTTYEISHSSIIDQKNHTLQHLNDNNDILYYQTYGGGGVGLGLLAGPFGVAANIKMIESNTRKDVEALKNKVLIDPKAAFKDAASLAEFDLASQASIENTKLTPYLLAEKTEGEKIMMASVIILERGEGKVKWIGKYLYQLPAIYTIDELSTLDQAKTMQLSTQVKDGFAALLSRIAAEESANLVAEQKITLKSEFLTPRFNFEMQGNLIEKNDGITWVRMIGSVCGVRNEHITYKMAKK